MATGKKKVIVYTDWIDQFEDLTDEEAGKLIKHFFRYINDLNPTADRLTELLFNPIKATLKRDLQQWEKKQEVNRENGAKGGRPRTQTQTEENPKNPVGFLKTQNNPEKGVSVSVSVNDSVSVKEKDNVISKKKINNILERKQKFAETLKDFSTAYPREMLKEFYEYWTEPNQSGTKFRKEMQKTWDLERRLRTWANNNNKFKTTQNGNTSQQRRTLDQQVNDLTARVLGINPEQSASESTNNGIEEADCSVLE